MYGPIESRLAPCLKMSCYFFFCCEAHDGERVMRSGMRYVRTASRHRFEDDLVGTLFLSIVSVFLLVFNVMVQRKPKERFTMCEPRAAHDINYNARLYVRSLDNQELKCSPLLRQLPNMPPPSRCSCSHEKAYKPNKIYIYG